LNFFYLCPIIYLTNLFYRIQQDLDDLDDLTTFSNVENESGYSSRVEAEQFGDLKENFVKEKMDSSFNRSMSDVEQFYLSRRKTRFLIEGEDKFNKLSDEIILMILKWLPKKCLVRIKCEIFNVNMIFLAKD